MEFNDYELVSLAQEGNEQAINIIYKKYRPIIIKKSKNAIMFASHHGIEINDIMQEGFIGLEEAIRDFSQDDKATFYTFANLCIDRQIVNFLRKMTHGKNKVLNEAIHIDETLESILRDTTDIEFSFFEKSQEIDIINRIKDNLTDFELKVFEMKYDGYNFDEIANFLGKDIKSIYNTFHRIKIKIKKYIEIDDYK